MNSILFSYVFVCFATICEAEIFIQDPYKIETYCELMQDCVPEETPLCGVDEAQQITAEFKNYCILFGVNCFKRQGLFIENDYETCIKNATISFGDRVLYYGKLTKFYMTGPFIAPIKKKNLDPHQENMLRSLMKLVS